MNDPNSFFLLPLSVGRCHSRVVNRRESGERATQALIAQVTWLPPSFFPSPLSRRAPAWRSAPFNSRLVTLRQRAIVRNISPRNLRPSAKASPLLSLADSPSLALGNRYAELRQKRRRGSGDRFREVPDTSMPRADYSDRRVSRGGKKSRADRSIDRCEFGRPLFRFIPDDGDSVAIPREADLPA